MFAQGVFRKLSAFMDPKIIISELGKQYQKEIVLFGPKSKMSYILQLKTDFIVKRLGQYVNVVLMCRFVYILTCFRCKWNGKHNFGLYS